MSAAWAEASKVRWIRSLTGFTANISSSKPLLFAMATIAFRLHQLRARTAKLTELKALDLGRTYSNDYGPLGCAGSIGAASKKVSYPSFWVHDVEQPLDLPDSGMATIKYKVTSKTTRTRDGKSKHDADIEIQSIEPVKATKPKLKLAAGMKIAHLGALLPGMIQLDGRPRNGSGQFSPEEAGGPNPHSVAAAYGPGAIAKTVGGVGAAAGLGGLAAARGGSAMRALASKIRR
jgi:hypothetical protein